jgi:hypothetical protein
MVRTGFFKAIYDATSKQVGVYVTPNTADNTFTLISADDLAERVGLDVYPMLSSEEKSKAAQVISPAQRTNCGRKKTMRGTHKDHYQLADNLYVQRYERLAGQHYQGVDAKKS